MRALSKRTTNQMNSTMMSTLSNNLLGSMFGFPDAPFIRDTKRAFGSAAWAAL
jgi:hypothetical protein